jgi:hypothetical protein
MQQIQFVQSKNSLPRNVGVIFLIVDLGIFIVVQIGAENQAAAHLEGSSCKIDKQRTEHLVVG